MTAADLIDGHVSSAQCSKAIDALLKHGLAHQEKLAENELLPGAEPHVWLVLAVKQMQPEKKLKPFKIPLAHPLVDPRSAGICLITKDPQREYKDLLAEKGVKFVTRVVGVAKLKGKWKPFEARRMLLRENGLFLADERVVPLLPKLLGKAFFQAKKQPLPVCLTRKDIKAELERAVSSTYMHQNQGTCTSIKVGNLSHTPAQLLSNLQLALPAIVKRIPGGWENIQAFHLKTSSSVALPVWSCKLEDAAGGRWEDVKAALKAVEMDDASSKKGKKRAAATTGEEEPKPAKKAKPSVAAPVVEEAALAPAPTQKKAAGAPKPTSATLPVSTTTKVTKSKTVTSTPGSSSPQVVDETVVETTEPTSTGKVRKTKIVETTTVTAVPEKYTSTKGKGKAAAPSTVDTPALVDAPAKAAKVSKAKAAAPIAASSSPPNATKKASAVPPSPAPTAAELKTKKAGLAGEKKKEKLLAKGSKDGRASAKTGLLGRKK